MREHFATEFVFQLFALLLSFIIVHATYVAIIRPTANALMQSYTVPQILLSAIERFIATRNIQDASMVVHTMCESEAERSESELSIIRYIAWAIPSIGFIGTVRGIGNALAQAQQAVAGDITGVTENLGVAFNSTLIALLLSVLLMLGAKLYCEKMLINRLKV
jgi:biopolymer transport protein ExbB/TolQ